MKISNSVIRDSLFVWLKENYKFKTLQNSFFVLMYTLAFSQESKCQNCNQFSIIILFSQPFPQINHWCIKHPKNLKRCDVYVKLTPQAALGGVATVHGPRFSRSGKSRALPSLLLLISRGRQQPVAPSVSLWNANRNIWIEKLLKRLGTFFLSRSFAWKKWSDNRQKKSTLRLTTTCIICCAI